MYYKNLADFKDFLLNCFDITEQEYCISHKEYLQKGKGVLFDYEKVYHENGERNKLMFAIHIHIWKKNIYKCSYWAKFDIEEEYKKYKNEALDIEDFDFDLQHYDTLLKDIFEDNFNEFEYKKL